MSSDCFYSTEIKGESMKTIGIVRRIEKYGIIGQKSRKPHKH